LGAHGIEGRHIQAATYLYRREDQGRSGYNHSPQQRFAFRRQIEAALPEVFGDG